MVNFFLSEDVYITESKKSFHDVRLVKKVLWKTTIRQPVKVAVFFMAHFL